MGQFAAAVPYIMAAVSAGAQMYNTNQTAKKQDAAQAEAIRNQGRIQRRADDRVGEEVTKLEASRSDDERAKRLDDYTKQLSANRTKMLAGLSPDIGSDVFKADSTKAAGQVEQYAADNAGLMSRMDAPQMQRQGEAFGFGRLATDTDMLARESRGQDFIDQLRASRIRRNPWLDAGAQVVGGIGSAYGSGWGMPGGTHGGVTGGMIPGTGQGAPGFGALGAGGGQWRHVPSLPPIRLPGMG